MMIIKNEKVKTQLIDIANRMLMNSSGIAPCIDSWKFPEAMKSDLFVLQWLQYVIFDNTTNL